MPGLRKRKQNREVILRSALYHNANLKWQDKMSSDPVFDIFREEAREHLSALEKAFLDLETAATTQVRSALINGLFRHAHSLKGDARVIGLGALKEAAQSLEDILEGLRNSPDKVERSTISQGLEMFDQVRAAFEAWQRVIEDHPEEEAQEHPAEPTARRGDSPLEPEASKIGQTTELPPQVLPETEPPEPHPPKAAAAPPEEAFTVRVSSDRLDRMLNLAGEVRISQRSADDIQQRLADLGGLLSKTLLTEVRLPQETSHRVHAALANWQSAVLDQARRIEGDLHKKRGREELLIEALENDIREARLLPLIMLADTLRRAVRDLAQSLGKDIRYEADVGKIMLDKVVIEAMKDPLLHLIRNAADHGIESPEQRRAAGKPATAIIRLQASRRGELVRITVSDDGRGIDYQRARAMVRQTGELEDVELGRLSEKDLSQYLFRPGFTTAPAGEVSGRGVGLDVARHDVQRLHGTIELDSSSAAGTTFAITVPVTVSTVRVLTVLAGDQYVGIPSGMIVRTGQVKPADLRELAGSLVLPIDGEPVRWVSLAELMGAAPSAAAADGQAWSYLLLAQQGRRIAVAVDDLEDEAEALLKPLGFPLGVLPGIVGATIRADGSVQLVLDLFSPSFTALETPRTSPRAEPKTARRILVVDDSPTTRAVLRNVFTAAGYSVGTASDGVDALEHLRSQLADLVVSDVEMPRLNGFDLTRQVKLRFGLPVILVTGKEKEEQRREGLEAGADAYVVKSTFQGQGLLDIVRQFI